MLTRPATRAPIARLNRGNPILQGCTFLATMADGAGALVRDLSGNGYDLAFSAAGSPAWNPSGGGRLGPAVGHTAVGGTGALGAVTMASLITAAEATLAVWWKPNNASAPAASAPTNGSGVISTSNRSIGISRGNVSSGGDKVWFFSGVSSASVATVSSDYDAGWNFSVLVHSGGTLYGYQNGHLAGSTADATSTGLTGNLQVAASGTARCLIGNVDFAATWNRALSAAEIWSLYVQPARLYAARPPTWRWVPDAVGSAPSLDLSVERLSFELGGYGPVRQFLEAPQSISFRLPTR